MRCFRILMLLFAKPRSYSFIISSYHKAFLQEVTHLLSISGSTRHPVYSKQVVILRSPHANKNARRHLALRSFDIKFKVSNDRLFIIVNALLKTIQHVDIHKIILSAVNFKTVF
jgi:hypothetical protein